MGNRMEAARCRHVVVVVVEGVDVVKEDFVN